MVKDHFVARTYLKHFGDASKGDMLRAYRKSDGKSFPCYPQDVCHEWDGDQNPLLAKKDLLGNYRKIFEPQWNSSIDRLLTESMSPEDIFAVSGYFANLMVCTPTWRRLGVTMYNHHAKAFLSFSKEMQKKHGGNPELPVAAIEMLEKGELSLEHNPDYVKAVATRQLLDYAWLTYHQDWTIIRNSTEYPFITSDNPVAILQSSNVHKPATRYLPVTPTLCLSVRYDRTKLPPFDPKLPPLGRVGWADAKSNGAKAINKLVVQCAEDLVFNSTASSGIEALVKNCARFRVEVDFLEFPANEPNAVYQGSIIRVRDTRLSASANK